MLCGLGLACFVAPLTTYVVVGVESAYAGMASGVNNAVARVAGHAGDAVAGVLVASVYTSTLDERAPDTPPAAERPRGRTRRPVPPPDSTGLPPDAAERRAAVVLPRATRSTPRRCSRRGSLALGAIIAGVGLRPPGGRAGGEAAAARWRLAAQR